LFIIFYEILTTSDWNFGLSRLQQHDRPDTASVSNSEIKRLEKYNGVPDERSFQAVPTLKGCFGRADKA
jgi:hypothetical protein